MQVQQIVSVDSMHDGDIWPCSFSKKRVSRRRIYEQVNGFFEGSASSFKLRAPPDVSNETHEAPASSQSGSTLVDHEPISALSC